MIYGYYVVGWRQTMKLGNIAKSIYDITVICDMSKMLLCSTIFVAFNLFSLDDVLN